ncbi:DOMON domain-containing protein frrs1L [Desmophyllum pertusum]|uniref:DOMON domain-containing protein frrs1L n=1 Tax=Desmophyllum pertusum TaxID=174260 RepID=A0A9W9YHR9_9CNID|nr:DOMON domain-containing protein frrs1L [Desmophyllum pertusum]
MARFTVIYRSLIAAGVFAVFLSEVSVSDGRIPPNHNPPPRLLFSTAGCGKTKSCYFTPNSCRSSPSSCDYFLTYTPKGSYITFEMSSNKQWVTVGFNHKAIMDGTDSIICSSFKNGSTLVGHYAVKGHQTPVRTTQTIKGLRVEGQSYEGGTIKCRFRREKQDNIMATDLNNKHLFVIFATGPIGPDNSLNEHDWKAHSMSPVNLAEIQILEASVYDLTVIQIHAVLMVIAWVGFATMGMFIARYMRPVWGEKNMCGTKVWFQVHRALMIVTALLTVAGAVFAFIYVGHWSEDAGAHPYIGIVVLSIAVAQPMIAFCRPPLDGIRRLQFNWAHRSFGLIALALAVINIFLGSVLPTFHLDNSAVYVMIVYLLVLVAVVVFEIYLACMKATDISNYRVLSKPQDDEVELTSAPVSRTQSDIKKIFRLHNVMFGVLILVVSIVCLAMLILITIHAEADDDDD